MVKSSLTTLPPKNTGNRWASQVTGLNMTGNVRFSSRFSTSLKKFKGRFETSRELIVVRLKSATSDFFTCSSTRNHLIIYLFSCFSRTLLCDADLRCRWWNTGRAIAHKFSRRWTLRPRISPWRSWLSSRAPAAPAKSRSSAYYARHPWESQLRDRIGLQQPTNPIDH